MRSFLFSLIALSAFFGRVSFSETTIFDVIVSHDPNGKTKVFSSEPSIEECRKKIKDLVCYVNPPNEEHPDVRDRPCLPDEGRFASYFEGHFDRSSELIQKMYCRLDHIWVEKQFFATAFASPLIGPQGEVISGAIGIREEVLNSERTFDEWLSWKEETSFGGTTSLDSPRLGILQYTSNRNEKEFFLDYVLDHEFGHLFDFSNQLNRVYDCHYEETSPGTWEPVGDCRPTPGSWGELSWKDIQTPKPSSDFPFRKDICFYFCGGQFLNPASLIEIFSGIMESTFMSTYASKHPGEDWAESFALFLAQEQKGFRYQVAAGSQRFDLTAHFYSEKIEPKRKFITDFLNDNVKYPGD